MRQSNVLFYSEIISRERSKHRQDCDSHVCYTSKTVTLVLLIFTLCGFDARSNSQNESLMSRYCFQNSLHLPIHSTQLIKSSPHQARHSVSPSPRSINRSMRSTNNGINPSHFPIPIPIPITNPGKLPHAHSCWNLRNRRY